MVFLLFVILVLPTAILAQILIRRAHLALLQTSYLVDSACPHAQCIQHFQCMETPQTTLAITVAQTAKVATVLDALLAHKILP